MKHHTSKHFAEPAAFVARQVRRHGLHTFLFTGASLGEGVTTTVLGIARELHLSFSLRVLALEINPHADGFKAVLEPDQFPTKNSYETSSSAKNIRAVPEGFTIFTLSQKIKGSNSNANLVDSLDEVLKAVKDHFDVVLIDTPPVLDGTEVLEVASEVDGVMLVVEAGRTRQEMLEHIRRMFAREELTILGGILTKQEHSIPNWFYRILFK